MNKKDKAKWICALRSGIYKQGRGALYNKFTNTFCCLGVARDIGMGRKSPGRQFLCDTFLEGIIQQELSEMNDCGKSFSEIADWIEENL